MESVFEYITLYAPAIIAVLSEIGVVAALLKRIKTYFEKAEKEVNELKEGAEYKKLKNQISLILDENRELKKNINILVEQITRVKGYNDECECEKCKPNN